MIEENKEGKKNENKINDVKMEKKEKKKEKENLKKIDPEKYSFEYFPEIVNEPEIHLPLKHIYTCELTDKIQIDDEDDERFQVYKKYQMNIYIKKITKEYYEKIKEINDNITNEYYEIIKEENEKATKEYYEKNKGKNEKVTKEYYEKIKEINEKASKEYYKKIKIKKEEATKEYYEKIKKIDERIKKDYYEKNYVKTDLIDNKGIKLTNDLNKKTKHPEIYPKKYGTYNFIHRLDGKIIAVGVWDILPTCLSSVSLYYDTDYQFLDLGYFTAIREIEYVKSFHDLIDNNFKYYTMGYYCETVQTLRYKGFFEPTELLDRYTMNYIYLKDVQKLISDGKNHKLSEKENNPNKKFMTKDEINKYIYDLTKDLNKKKEDKYFKKNSIKKTKRFIELIPIDLLSKLKFIAKPDK